MDVMRAGWPAALLAMVVLAACSSSVSGDGTTASASRPASSHAATTPAPAGPAAPEIPGTTEPAPPAEDGPAEDEPAEDEPAEEEPPADAADWDVDGAWTGTTSQDRMLTFTVTDHTVTALAISGFFGGDSCAVHSTAFTTSAPNPIAGPHFIAGSTLVGTLVNGMFDSETEAHGTVDFIPNLTQRDLLCVDSSATWTATKAA
jgi:hypothetical protein